MRILVVAARTPIARAHAALVGLARRGHEVMWLGAGAPEVATVRAIRGLRELGGWQADLVACDGPEPFRAARWGWLAHVHAMVLPLSQLRVARWGVLERLAWGSLHSHGLLEPAEGEAFQSSPHGVDLERVGLWPEVEVAEGGEAAHPDVEILERACERAIARHRGRGDRAGLFLDRDGTLVREVGYLSDPADLELLPGVDDALRRAQATGAALVVISNQAGVGRGLFPLERVYEAMARLRVMLRERGVELDAIHFCPHRPGEGCVCRKPAPGLLQRAAEDLQLRLSESLMVGDKRLDAATGHAAGARGVLVRSGYGREEEQAIESAEFAPPDRVCDDLPAAVTWWLDDGRALGPRTAAGG